jgi:hypothetical protein
MFSACGLAKFAIISKEYRGGEFIRKFNAVQLFFNALAKLLSREL